MTSLERGWSLLFKAFPFLHAVRDRIRIKALRQLIDEDHPAIREYRESLPVCAPPTISPAAEKNEEPRGGSGLPRGDMALMKSPGIEAEPKRAERADFDGVELKWANLRWARLSGSSFQGAELEGSNLIEAVLRGANLRGANLRGAHMMRADLRGADLRGADMTRANIAGASVEGASFDERTRLPVSERAAQTRGMLRDQKPSRGAVRFTWNIHWSCNYRCSYCFFDGEWAELGKRNKIASVEEWTARWRAIREQYGRCYLTINGGEPFAYPNFIELLERVSEIHWPINVTTNGSLHLEEFVRRIDAQKVSLSLSFHPQYWTIEEMLAKVAHLREKGAHIGCLNFVAYPPFLKDLPGYVSAFEERGESLKVIPFVGTYEGVRYPEGYTDKQKETIGMEDGWIEGKRHRGMQCRAGFRSALILPDGKVTRCGQVGDRGVFGDFFDPGFSLLASAAPCDEDFCPCDEWKVIPDETAPETAGAYLP